MNFDDFRRMWAKELPVRTKTRSQSLLVSYRTLAALVSRAQFHAAAKPTAHVSISVLTQQVRSNTTLGSTKPAGLTTSHPSPKTAAADAGVKLCGRSVREAIHDTTLLTAQRPIFTFDGRTPPVALAVAADRIHGAES